MDLLDAPDDLLPGGDDLDRSFAIASSGAAIAAGVATRSLMKKVWARRGAVPGNPAADGIRWRDAIVFAVVSSVAVGLARLVGQYLATNGWEKVTGKMAPVR